MSALAIGSIQLVSVGATTDSLLAPAATGGSGSAITYQYFRDVSSSSFTPGSGNEVSGATSLALSDSGLTPGTVYYYKIVADDGIDQASSAALTVQTTAASPNPNQFSLAPFLGMLDQRFNGDTMSVQFDSAGSGSLVGGQAVKFSTESTQSTSLAGAGNGAILVVPADGSDDDVCGFVNYDIKSAVFGPGDRMEISLAGNVMYLYATAAIDRGERVFSLPAAEAGGTNGGVAPATGSSSNPIVGYSLDTSVSGQLMRVFLQTPSNDLDA